MMIWAWRPNRRRRYRRPKWALALCAALVLLGGWGRGWWAGLIEPAEPQPALALALLGKRL